MFHRVENCIASKYILKCLILWPSPLVIWMWPFGGHLSQRSSYCWRQKLIQVSLKKRELVKETKAKQ